MVSREIQTPLYIQVYEYLLRAINGGIYQPGQMLPPEKDLGATYNVDRQTVRRSLELLVNEGLVEKRAGVGTFVKDYSRLNLPEHDDQGTVAFILPRGREGGQRIAEPFNAKLFHSFEEHCRRNSRHLIYKTASGANDVRRLRDDVEGVFVVSRVAPDVIAELRRQDIPIVVVNDYRADLICVIEDSFDGALKGVSYLVGLAHRRIGFIGGIPDHTPAEQRFIGYLKALHDAGLPLHEMPRSDGDWTFDGGFRAMQAILMAPGDCPTAVFAANDVMAIGAMHAIRNAGMRVPDDISVLGYDDVDLCRYVMPHLSTIRVDLDLVASIATATLFQLAVSRSTEVYKIVVPVSLVARGTTNGLSWQKGGGDI